MINEKIEIAKLMDEIGVAIIAVGFPMVSEQERHHAQQNKKQILKRFDQCQIESSHLKADLTEEEILALAKSIVKAK